MFMLRYRRFGLNQFWRTQKFDMVLMGYSGTRKKPIHGKKIEAENLVSGSL
jgi:hypothetical protein